MLRGADTKANTFSGALKRGDGRALDALAQLSDALSSVGALGCTTQSVNAQAAKGVACQAASTKIEAC